jgi:hypothetical protein
MFLFLWRYSMNNTVELFEQFLPAIDVAVHSNNVSYKKERGNLYKKITLLKMLENSRNGDYEQTPVMYMTHRMFLDEMAHLITIYDFKPYAQKAYDADPRNLTSLQKYLNKKADEVCKLTAVNRRGNSKLRSADDHNKKLFRTLQACIFQRTAKVLLEINPDLDFGEMLTVFKPCSSKDYESEVIQAENFIDLILKSLSANTALQQSAA